MYKKILTIILGLTFLSSVLLLANPSWTGDIDNDWDVAGNWSTNQVLTVIPEPATAGLILAAVIPSLLLLRSRLGTSRSTRR